ncbi:PAS domain S-box-containing protein [Methanocalculus alkaliphilus]|uniref:PAS domain S-box protein n=1 Tax=Methanocalculus alkaliphilus TaxID=768730 RepID=UPI00209E06EE|nr:PAS domain S-box protein [Methanocalculus alkaliphilus]MCP1714428.1 PAS domain S-box-containing protein [Methanocalculus alkaliphilus]
MESPRREFAEIRDLLKDHPKGMSVTEVARALGRNKHSTGRYLDSLYASGQVEMRTVGMAKIYSLAHRLPLTSLISTMRERIMILDADRQIILINEACAAFIGVPVDEVTGRDIGYIPARDPAIIDLLATIKDHTVESEEIVEYSVLMADRERTDLHIHIIPSMDDAHREVYVVVMVDITDHVRMVDELREREQQYRQLVEMAGAIILKLDNEGRITFFNDFAEEFFGYSREEIIGESVIGTIVPPEEMDGRNLQFLIREICTGADAYRRNENANITRDGRLVWVRWSNSPIRDDEGNVTGILSVGNDISDRKAMELELTARKDQLERRVQEIECIHKFSDTIDPRNTLPEILAGIVRVIGRCWSKRGTTAVRITHNDEIYESGVPEGLPFAFSHPIVANGVVVGVFEAGFGGRDEDPDYLESKERLLTLFAERTGWTIEWMEGEAELRNARDLSETLIETVDAVIFVLDPEGRITRFNRKAEEMTGYLAAEVMGRTIWDIFVAPEMIEGIRSHITTLTRTRKSARIRTAWIAKDGARKKIDWSNTVITDERGEVTHIISTGIDVTRQVEDEEELRRCRSVLDRFLAGEEEK